MTTMTKVKSTSFLKNANNNKVNSRIDATMEIDDLLHVPFYLQTQHDE